LRDLVIKLNDEIVSDDQVSLKSIHDDIIDDILYLQDIYSLKLDQINYILTNCLFYYLILPLLCGSLVSMTKPKVAISIGLYIILSLCHYIKDEGFLNSLYLVVFNPKANKELKKLIEDYPRNVKNYHFDWTSQKKVVTGSFTNYISCNFSEPFVRSLLFQVNSQYPEVLALTKKYEKVQDDISSSKFFGLLLEDVLSKFSNSEIDIMTNYHTSLSKATGVNIGLSTTDAKQECVSKVVENILLSLKEENSANYINYECRENILTYLKSKDDTLILLVSLLINSVHKKNIAKQLLIASKLLPADSLSSEYDTNKILDELFNSTLKDPFEDRQDISEFYVGNNNASNSNEKEKEYNTIENIFNTGVINVNTNNKEKANDVNNTTDINTNNNESKEVESSSLQVGLDKIEINFDGHNDEPDEIIDTTTDKRDSNVIIVDNIFITKLLGNATEQTNYDIDIVDSLLNVKIYFNKISSLW
jgi:hypothetical protein